MQAPLLIPTSLNPLKREKIKNDLIHYIQCLPYISEYMNDFDIEIPVNSQLAKIFMIDNNNWDLYKETTISPLSQEEIYIFRCTERNYNNIVKINEDSHNFFHITPNTLPGNTDVIIGFNIELMTNLLKDPRIIAIRKNPYIMEKLLRNSNYLSKPSITDDDLLIAYRTHVLLDDEYDFMQNTKVILINWCLETMYASLLSGNYFVTKKIAIPAEHFPLEYKIYLHKMDSGIMASTSMEKIDNGVASSTYMNMYNRSYILCQNNKIQSLIQNIRHELLHKYHIDAIFHKKEIVNQYKIDGKNFSFDARTMDDIHDIYGYEATLVFPVYVDDYEE